MNVCLPKCSVANYKKDRKFIRLHNRVPKENSFIFYVNSLIAIWTIFIILKPYFFKNNLIGYLISSILSILTIQSYITIISKLLLNVFLQQTYLYANKKYDWFRIFKNNWKVVNCDHTWCYIKQMGQLNPCNVIMYINMCNRWIPLY